MKLSRSERIVVRLFLLLSALGSLRVQAALIAYEPFDYPPSSNLSSNAGRSGWVGSWIYSPLISNHGTINATNLIYGKLSYAGRSLRSVRDKFLQIHHLRRFLLRSIYVHIYLMPMKTLLSPQSLIEQILKIQRMEHGSLSIIRQRPNGPYYNLTSSENA